MDASTESRAAAAKAKFIETLAQVRRDEMAGKYGKPSKQANAANVAMLDAAAAKLRAR